MVAAKGCNLLEGNGLSNGAKVMVEISWGKWLWVRAGGLRFLVTK